MLGSKFLPLILKQTLRRPTRSLLTILGVAIAMFMFCVVEAIQAGMREATEQTANDTTLVVYRENRFCPFTSKLPETYRSQIERIPGVVSVQPMKVVVNNCRTSLDVVTYRGVDGDLFVKYQASELKILSGSVADWSSRSDAALVGEALATRRGLKVGDRFSANGTVVHIASIFQSDEPQDQNVAYVHLDFLQRAPGLSQVGVVTQFNVRVSDPAKLKAVAERIDAEFKTDQAPTSTRGEKAFIARAVGDLLELIRFTRWLSLGCVVAVLALVANAIVLSVQDRVREHAVMQTLGFRSGLLARLIVGEGMLLSLLGGLLGTLAALALLKFGSYSLSNEGLSINFAARPELLGMGLLVSVALGVFAGMVPAWQASRAEIAAAFRM
jgi:putative ABC transport system permease protein